jgi:DNA-directed RNA polymerase subunit RPC12/RpoP
VKPLGIPLQYACFVCRKSFKRPQFSGARSRFMTSEQAAGQQRESERFANSHQYKCPDCGGQAYFIGIDFKAPKRSDVKEWREVEQFIRSGKLYNRH